MGLYTHKYDVELFVDDLVNSSADATSKLMEIKSSRGSDRKVYTSVEEFMADRQTLIDVVVERRRNLQVSKGIGRSRATGRCPNFMCWKLFIFAAAGIICS